MKAFTSHPDPPLPPLRGEVKGGGLFEKSKMSKCQKWQLEAAIFDTLTFLIFSDWPGWPAWPARPALHLLGLHLSLDPPPEVKAFTILNKKTVSFKP